MPKGPKKSVSLTAIDRQAFLCGPVTFYVRINTTCASAMVRLTMGTNDAIGNGSNLAYLINLLQSERSISRIVSPSIGSTRIKLCRSLYRRPVTQNRTILLQLPVKEDIAQKAWYFSIYYHFCDCVKGLEWWWSKLTCRKNNPQLSQDLPCLSVIQWLTVRRPNWNNKDRRQWQNCLLSSVAKVQDL